MKKLYLIGGTMGVGKSAVCKILNIKLPNCVYLDADWCWNSSPFIVTDETKAMVIDNIIHLLNNFIKCSEYRNVVFCWVMHEQSIIDDLLRRIKTDDCEVVKISLICSEPDLKQRLTEDIKNGLRTPDIIERSVKRLPLYGKLDTIKIDTTDKSAETVADEIIKM